MKESYVHKGVRYWREVPDPTPTFAKPKLSFRQVMGEVLREQRLAEKKSLRDITGVSIGFVSEVERGKKEASTEVVEAICASLDVSLADVLRTVADRLEGKVLVDV